MTYHVPNVPISAGMEPPVEAWSDVSRQEFDMLKHMTVQALLGYLQSWSCYNTFKKLHPEAADPLQQFGHDVLKALNTTNASCQLTIRFPVFLILAKPA